MIHRTSTLKASQQKDSSNNGDGDERAARFEPLVADKGNDDHAGTACRAQYTFHFPKVFFHLHGQYPSMRYSYASIAAFMRRINHMLLSILRQVHGRSTSPGLFLLIIMILILPLSVNALGTRDEILQQVEVIMSSSELQTAAIENGRKSSTLCSQCHGYDGNSSYPWVPNLASQNPIYFIEQSLRFQQQKRKDHVMSEVIKLLSDKQLVELAVYYSSRSLRLQGNAGKAVVSRGENLYQIRCEGCHGEKGLGGSDKSYAWLAGQQAEYLVRTLKRFRDGSDMRGHPTMASVTVNLTDTEIESLAAYLSSLH